MKPHCDLGIKRNRAWHLVHRIRETWSKNEGLSGGPVEIDETYIGGKEIDKHEADELKAGRCSVGKKAVVGIKSLAWTFADTTRAVQGVAPPVLPQWHSVISL